VKTILVIETNQDLLDMLNMALSGAGYQTIPCLSYEQALPLLYDQDIDLVLGCIGHWCKDAFDFIPHAHALNIPAIAMLGHTEPMGLRDAGFSDAVMKPFDLIKLYNKIDTLIKENAL
jgi:DNA-binding response OmpR family regulator